MRSLAIILVTGGLAFASVPALGQTQTEVRYKDGVARIQGKMVQLTNGRIVPMYTHLTLPDGTLVNTDGSVHPPNGKSHMLEEGMAINHNGRVVILKDDMLTRDVIDKASEDAGYKQTTIITNSPDGKTTIEKE